MACPITSYKYAGVFIPTDVYIFNFETSKVWIGTLAPSSNFTPSPNGWPNPFVTLNSSSSNEIKVSDKESIFIDFTANPDTTPIVTYTNSTVVPFTGSPQNNYVDFTTSGLPLQYSPYCCGTIKDKGSCPSKSVDYTGQGFDGKVSVYNMDNNTSVWPATYKYNTPPSPSWIQPWLAMVPTKLNVWKIDKGELHIDFTSNPNNSPTVSWLNSSRLPFSPPTSVKYTDFAQSNLPLSAGSLCCKTSNLALFSNVGNDGWLKWIPIIAGLIVILRFLFRK